MSKNIEINICIDPTTQSYESLYPKTLIDNNILSQDLIEYFNLSNNGTLSQLLKQTGRFDVNVGNEYIWQKGKLVYYETTPQYQDIHIIYIDGRNSSVLYNIPYSDSIDFDSTGQPFLKNPQNLSVSTNTKDVLSQLKGKYCQQMNLGVLSSTVIYVSPTSEITTNSGSGPDGYSVIIYTMSASYVTVSSTYQIYGYVNSNISNKYPLTPSDEYDYISLGRLGEKLKLYIGKYIGNGKYGPSNPNTISFNFIPKLISIPFKDRDDKMRTTTYGNNNSYLYTIFTDYLTINYVVYDGFGYNSKTYGKKSDDGKSIMWYADGAATQLNDTNNVYYYYAIG